MPNRWIILLVGSSQYKELLTVIIKCNYHIRRREVCELLFGTNINLLLIQEVVKAFLSILHQLYVSLLFWMMHTLVSVISAWNCCNLSALSNLAFLMSAAFRRFAHLVNKCQILLINMKFHASKRYIVEEEETHSKQFTLCWVHQWCLWSHQSWCVPSRWAGHRDH